MPAPEYTAVTGGEVALTANVARTALGWKAHANSGLLLTYYEVSFDGTSATAEPVLVEICYATWATNAPGTASTSVTPAQELGRVLTVGATAGKTWTTEPTVLTVLRERSIPAFGGVVLYDYPLGKEPDCALAEGFAIRCTAPANVSVRATMKVSRC
ncbi:MAG TPA: hypothetical protein DGT23_35300 [Micromonosporaceae bacterium]|nr:hypothetical protein [Micromonosporaceae bacterium]